MKSIVVSKTFQEVEFGDQSIKWTSMNHFQEIHLDLHDAGVYFWVFLNPATGSPPTVRGYVIANDGQSEMPGITVPKLVEYIRQQLPAAYADPEVQQHLIFPLLKLVQ